MTEAFTKFSPADPGHYSLSAFGQRDLPVDVKSAEGDHISEPGRFPAAR